MFLQKANKFYIYSSACQGNLTGLTFKLQLKKEVEELTVSIF